MSALKHSREKPAQKSHAKVSPVKPMKALARPATGPYRIPKRED